MEWNFSFIFVLILFEIFLSNADTQIHVCHKIVNAIDFDNHTISLGMELLTYEPIADFTSDAPIGSGFCLSSVLIPGLFSQHDISDCVSLDKSSSTCIDDVHTLYLLLTFMKSDPSDADRIMQNAIGVSRTKVIIIYEGGHKIKLLISARNLQRNRNKRTNLLEQSSMKMCHRFIDIPKRIRIKKGESSSILNRYKYMPMAPDYNADNVYWNHGTKYLSMKCSAYKVGRLRNMERQTLKVFLGGLYSIVRKGSCDKEVHRKQYGAMFFISLSTKTPKYTTAEQKKTHQYTLKVSSNFSDRKSIVNKKFNATYEGVDYKRDISYDKHIGNLYIRGYVEDEDVFMKGNTQILGTFLLSQFLRRRKSCHSTRLIKIKKRRYKQSYRRQKPCIYSSIPSYLFLWRSIHQVNLLAYPLHRDNTIDLSNYMHRLGTFKSSSNGISLRPHELASNGFYASGRSDETTCFSCGFSYSDWKRGDDPRQIHYQASPNCPFIRKNTSRDECDHSRNGAGVSVLRQNEHHVKTKSTNGLSSERTDTRATNFNPSKTLENTKTENGNPLANGHNSSRATLDTQYNCYHVDLSHTNGHTNTQHTLNDTLGTQLTNSNVGKQIGKKTQGRQEGENLFNRGSNQTNGPLSLRTCDLSQDQYPSNGTEVREDHPADDHTTHGQEIYNDRPRYPSYAVLTVRISSFQGWPSYLTQTPRTLALAGFLYAGTFLHFTLKDNV